LRDNAADIPLRENRDIPALPLEQTEFLKVLEASGSYTSFATEYIHGHRIADGWEVRADAMDQLRIWLAERQIQPTVQEWISNRGFIQSRLKTEIYTVAPGVKKGDEVEVQFDPQVQKALEAVLNPAA
jgi:hypothetical protein